MNDAQRVAFDAWFEQAGWANEHELAMAAWEAALDATADSFASQTGQMQMCSEQRMLITVAERIRKMKQTP